MLSVYEALSLMLAFGSLIIALIMLMLKIAQTKK